MYKHITDYPRPQLARDSFINLNGPWNFSFDDGDAGIREGYPDGLPDPMKIEVPFTYETKASGIGDPQAHPVVWYEKTVRFETLTATTLIHFEGVDYTASLYVNGRFIGVHSGAYARFSFDISGAIRLGDNRITLRAADGRDAEQPRGKQRWMKESTGCWYVQTTGIWKTVWMEQLGASYLESLKLTPDFDKRTVRIEAAAVNAAGLDAEITISFQDTVISRKRHKLGGGLYDEAALDSGELMWGVACWSPGAPNLYDVRIRLLHGETALDEVSSYFGLRKISVEGREVRLNNAPLYQRLVLDQGYWPDSGLTPPGEEALIADIDHVLALGFNGVRKHQKTEDERFLYWCDVKGVLVWSEMASAYRYSDRAAERFTAEWREIVRQNYNHPCIVTWVPFNESWGIESVMTDRSQQHFTEAIYHLTKAFDLTRPVICNDGWEHTVSDIITLHDYTADLKAVFRRYTEGLERILGNGLSHNCDRYAFAGHYSYRGQPVMISEYGGAAYGSGEGWGYNDSANTPDELTVRIAAVTELIRKMPGICGFCYTQLTDVEQEINGLLFPDRTLKAEGNRLREIFG